MSRIGNAIINIPSGVEIKLEDQTISVKGKKGELSQIISKDIEAKIEDNTISFNRKSETNEVKALHGLYRSLVNNMITGVTDGFEKKLELVGVGYRASNQGQKLELALGFSHLIVLQIPSEITIATETVKGKNPIVTLSSHDNQLLGMVVAKIRSFRKPEPYKGKGVRFVGEQIRTKAGKSA